MNIRTAVCALLALCLAACGGGGGGSGGSAAAGSAGGSGGGDGGGGNPTYPIGGTISGLSAGGLVLADNGGDYLSVPARATSFTFATRLGAGDGYNVAVATPPSGETCTVGASTSTGIVAGAVTSVTVTCSASTFTISGTIRGLTAAGLRLQYYSGGPILPVNAGATTFAFSETVEFGTGVQMNVVAQPYQQWCSPGVGNFSGPIKQNITADALSCAAASGHVTVLAGSAGVSGHADGTGGAASFDSPAGIALDAAGDMFVADAGNNEIRKITGAGVVTTLAGSTGPGSSNGAGAAAQFNSPEGVAVDSSGNIFVADTDNNEIRKISPTGDVTVFAGSTTPGDTDGTGTAASFNKPAGVAVDSAGDVYVADTGNNEIRMITPTGVVTTPAGSPTAGDADGTGSAASFNQPYGVAVSSSGNVYVADFGNNEIREMTSAGVVTTLAGSAAQGSADGVGSSASFYGPTGVAVDPDGDVFVADANNNEIRKITPGGAVTTLAGSTTGGDSNGAGSAASFKLPFGVAVTAPSGVLYVTDFGNNQIREVTPGA